LCEAFQTPHAIDAFERHYTRCKDILQQHEHAVRACIAGDPPSEADRCSRYIRLLAAKAQAHPHGPEVWLAESGSLVKEMWRYFGAIRGEAGEHITVLKPIWQTVVQRKLPGGMHHGHIAAMIDAVFDANQQAMNAFQQTIQRHDLDDFHVTSDVDVQIERHIMQVLRSHYDAYHFESEETPAQDRTWQPGDRRFLIDPIDGTRNFVEQREEFGIAIACQEFTANGWVTTDAVVSHPPTGKILWAERNNGAFVIDRNDQEMRLSIARRVQQLRGTLIDFSATGFGIDGQVHIFRQVLEVGGRFRNGGSVGLMLARLAGRGSTACIVTAQEHDVAAGLLIAQEAGAAVRQFTFQRPHGVVTATIAAVSEALVDQLMRLMPPDLNGITQP
jgi:fructose-1,6-bisphosphatase/inositol monophosphatase family enzyme